MGLLNRILTRPTTKEVKAVYEEDWKNYLESLGIYEEVRSGEQECAICGDQVSLDNIGTVYPHDKQILVSCDKSTCISTTTE